MNIHGYSSTQFLLIEEFSFFWKTWKYVKRFIFYTYYDICKQKKKKFISFSENDKVLETEIFFTLININIFPIVAQMVPQEKIDRDKIYIYIKLRLP